MITILKWVWAQKFYLLLAAVILWLAVARFTSDRAHAAEIAAREQQFQQTAQKLGAAVAEEKSASQIAAELSDKNAALVAALKKAEAASHVVEHTTDTVVIHDQVPGVGTPTTWDDKYGRFHLDLPSGVLTRDQRFRLEGVIVEGPGGAKVRGVTLIELAPKTGEVIPNEGTTIESHFEVVKDAPAISAWHPRALAVLGSGGYGLGAQLLNWHDRFDLDAVAVYNPGGKSVRIGPAVAWRVKLPWLDTNLAIGPSYLYDVKVGTWTLGALATIELTR